MSRDIYPALTAASASWRHLEHISNNLANVNSIGYKERRVSFETVMASANGGKLSEGYVKIKNGNIVDTDGSLIQDNVDTHFALRGQGFFAVESNTGETLLMRSGSFQLNTEGFLVNVHGEKVLSTTGPIQFDDYQRSQFSLSSDGRFLDERGAEFAQLAVMDGKELQPLGGTRWRGENLRNIDEPVQVVQGALESSNVNPFRTMIEMMETTRHFEMYQKSIQSSRQMNNSLNQMTRRSP